MISETVEGSFFTQRQSRLIIRTSQIAAFHGPANLIKLRRQYPRFLMKVLTNVQRKSNGNPTPPASTTASPAAGHVYYFGPFCLNQREQQLLRNGEPIRLAPKAFDVLLVLIQNKGCL